MLVLGRMYFFCILVARFRCWPELLLFRSVCALLFFDLCLCLSALRSALGVLARVCSLLLGRVARVGRVMSLFSLFGLLWILGACYVFFAVSEPGCVLQGFAWGAFLAN